MGVGIIGRIISSFTAFVLILMVLSSAEVGPDPPLSALLSPTLKNAEPAMKATRKVRQKVDRAKAIFKITVDGRDKPNNDQEGALLLNLALTIIVLF